MAWPHLRSLRLLRGGPREPVRHSGLHRLSLAGELPGPSPHRSGLNGFHDLLAQSRFDDCDLSFDDYCQLGVMDALDSIDAVLSGQRVHLAGYCLGGTLAAIAAAAMARDGDGRLSSLTLFAGQVDFTEAGRFTLFVNESQITFPESLMRSTGTLDARQMAGAFRLLRSNDLIWSRMVNSYLLGRREETTALAAWNADATRIPARMQSEYLRRLFLDSDLAEGRFRVGGQPVTLGDIRVPVFAVGTERNHIAPWRSVFELTLLTEAEVSFVLASGRHNAGIVAALEEPGRRYRVHTRTARDHYLDPAFWTGLAGPRTVVEAGMDRLARRPVRRTDRFSPPGPDCPDARRSRPGPWHLCPGGVRMTEAPAVIENRTFARSGSATRRASPALCRRRTSASSRRPPAT